MDVADVAVSFLKPLFSGSNEPGRVLCLSSPASTATSKTCSDDRIATRVFLKEGRWELSTCHCLTYQQLTSSLVAVLSDFWSDTCLNFPGICNQTAPLSPSQAMNSELDIRLRPYLGFYLVEANQDG